MLRDGFSRPLEVANMSVLVGYASAYGSTKGIAKEIGDRLTTAGLQADVRPIDEIEAIDTYDAVVLGSAIHNMAWLPQAAALVRSHTADLAVRPVWLFSVSSVGETSSFFGPRVARFMRRMRNEPKEIAGFRQAIRPRDHRNFAGAVERTHWNLAGHLFLKAFGGSYGDHRDKRDVDTWTDGIARQLLATQKAASA
jgi:menaquinone-dependent protoporphyrinogen oxidase